MTLHATLRRTALLLVALFAPIAAQAQEACQGENILEQIAHSAPEKLAQMEAEEAKIPNGDGLLWRIDKEGLAPSYLFGTVHLTDDRLTGLAPPVRQALTSVSRIIVENTDMVDPQKAARAMAENAQYMTFTDGSRLSAHLSEDQRALLAKALGGSLAAVENLKPWMLAAAMSTPPCEAARRAGHEVVDTVIAKHASDNALELIGLESVAEQLSAFDSIPLDLQAEFLISTVLLSLQRENIFATMSDLYLERRIGMIDAMSRVLSSDTGISEQAYLAFTTKLVDQRNAVMALRAAPHVAKGAAMVAVGALHLPGKTGLVEQFRAQGYEVTRVY